MQKHYTGKQKAQIVLEMLKEEKTVTQISSEYGIHPSQLYKWKAQALEKLHTLFENDGKTEKAQQSDQEQKLNELYSEIGRLSTQLSWIKKNLASNMSREQRLALIEREQSSLSLSTQTELLGLNRTSLYYQPVPPSEKEVAVKHRIDEIYTRYPFYGSRRMTVTLCKEILINRKTVQHYMQEMGIAGICPGPNLSKRNLEHQIYPYLLRNVTSSYPNHIWGIDITYIRLVGGWMYLVAVLDWFSRYIVSWDLDQTLEMPFVLSTVERALAQAAPVIWNSDQGSHFTSSQYIERLLAANVQVSMDGKGRALDNIFTERLWRTIKYEEVYLHDYSSPRGARQGLTQYLNYYNFERPHQSLDYHTPADVYYHHGIGHDSLINLERKSLS